MIYSKGGYSAEAGLVIVCFDRLRYRSKWQEDKHGKWIHRKDFKS